MCYDISYLTRRQADYARRYGTEEDVEDIVKRIGPVWHTNGFQHPFVPVVIDEKPGIRAFSWGLVPFWVKTVNDLLNIRGKTLNARGETIYELPSFRRSAASKRCLVIVDGFFEHHHEGKKVIPYFIKRKDRQPFALGGLWDEWVNRDDGTVHFSCTIITTTANKRM